MTIHKRSIEWPDLELFSDTAVFNTKAVVQQTGISAPTLRAWERRYDLLSPGRATNDYRLYSERDVVLIRWLKDCIDRGMSISQATALFHHLSQERQKRTAEVLKEQKAGEPFEHVVPVTEEDRFSPLEREEQPLLSMLSHLDAAHSSPSYPATHSIPFAREHLIEAFRNLDEPTAAVIMSSMLAIYSVEQVCTDLITPTLWQIGQLWADGQITVVVEHFASNFFRALLANLFYVTPTPREGPLTLACCAPGEPHELAALMLALFLRRQQVRVAYLGQSIEIEGLLHTIKKLSPALVCISLTMPSYLAPLVALAEQIQQMPAPRPIFSFGGQIFAHYSHVIPQIPGIHLEGELLDIVVQLQRMVIEKAGNKN